MFIFTWRKKRDDYELRLAAQKETIQRLKDELETAKNYIEGIKISSALFSIKLEDVTAGKRFIHVMGNYLVERLLVERAGKYALLQVDSSETISGPNAMGWVDSKEKVLEYLLATNYRLLAD